MIPPLQNSYFERLNPAKGKVSLASDALVIDRLVNELRPYMHFVEVGYIGGRNASGERHGRGTMTHDNGNKYEGEWEYDKMHGYGTWLCASGGRFDGEWKEDKKHGQGKYLFSSGT